MWISHSSSLTVLMLEICLVAFLLSLSYNVLTRDVFIQKTIFHLPVKKSMHEITLIMKQAGMICFLHFAHN